MVLSLNFYHGSENKRDTLQASSEGLFGAGIYLTSDRQDALQYGECLAIVEAQLKRPFYTVIDYSIAEENDCDSPAGSIINVFTPPPRRGFYRHEGKARGKPTVFTPPPRRGFYRLMNK